MTILQIINRIILPVLRPPIPLRDRLSRWLDLMEPKQTPPRPEAPKPFRSRSAYKVLLRRGSLAEHPEFIPASGEAVYDTAEKRLYIGTGNPDTRVVPYHRGPVLGSKVLHMPEPPPWVLEVGEAVYVYPLDRMTVGDGVTVGGNLQGDPV